MDASASTGISWFDDPSVSFWLCLLQLHKVLVKFVEFRGQNVSVRYEIVLLTPIFLLGTHKVETEPVFSRNLVRHWEMVDSLVLI